LWFPQRHSVCSSFSQPELYIQFIWPCLISQETV
jgi:hypothetical protein